MNRFDMEMAAKILQIHLSKDDTNEEDKSIWTKTPSSKFLAKSVYKLLSDSARSTSALHDYENKKF